MNLADETILVIDDDPLQLEIFATNLTHLGVGRVLVASNGETALKILGQKQSDVTTLLLDVCMPQMDGPQLLRKLAALGCKSRINVGSFTRGQAVSLPGIIKSNQILKAGC
jgi:CheY-like chemotaxis protein